tara:strand:+ start:50 stop:766 length:717 start_codon:yes stop_codon:yes gene_type:complete
MLTLQECVTNTHEIGFQHFGPFTYVLVKSGQKRKCSADKGIATPALRVTKPKGTGFCITRTLYEAHKDKPFFFLHKVTMEDQFEAVTHRFFQAYKAGVAWKLEFSEWHIDVLKALKAGKFERVVKNRYSNDHTLLDHKDQIIYHCVRMDYVNGQLRDGNYHLDKLAAHLRKRKDVRAVDVINIPYYNAEHTGERAIEFTYVPPTTRWNQFVEWYYPDTVGGKYTLFEKLGISKFRKDD